MFSLRKHPLTEDVPRKPKPTGKSKRGDAARVNALYRQDDTRPAVALSTIGAPADDHQTVQQKEPMVRPDFRSALCRGK